jgi:hypothetical protein
MHARTAAMPVLAEQGRFADPAVTVSPGWMPFALAFTVLVTLVAAEVVALTVLPSELASMFCQVCRRG